MTLVGLLAVLPDDFNVPFLHSLLCYPTIGFAVGIVFRLPPISLGFVISSIPYGDVDQTEPVWRTIVAVSVPEPIFQLQFGFSRAIPLWAEAYIGATVFAINLAHSICSNDTTYLRCARSDSSTSTGTSSGTSTGTSSGILSDCACCFDAPESPSYNQYVESPSYHQYVESCRANRLAPKRTPP